MRSNDSLVIEDTEVSLPIDFKFAVTVELLSLSDLSLRSVTFTNTITLPWSDVNRLFFEFLLDESIIATKQNRKLSCRYYRDGTLMPPNICVIDQVSSDGIDISLYEELINLSDTISDKTIQSLKYLTNTTWQAAYIDSARLNSTQVLNRVIHFGYTPFFSASRYLPCFSYNEIIQKILTQTGLTLSGSILTDTDFTDLVIPFMKAKFEYDATPQFDFKAIDVAAIYFQQFVQTGLGPYNFGYGGLLGTITGNWIVGTSGYTDTIQYPASAEDTFELITVAVDFLIGDNGAGAPWAGTFVLSLYHETSSGVTQVATSGAIASTGAMNYHQQWLPAVQQITLTANSKVYARIESITTIGLNITITNLAGVYAGFRGDGQRVVDTANVNWNKLLPSEIKQADFITDFKMRFGIISKLVDQTLYLKTVKEITDNTVDVNDWSDKRVVSKKSIAFKLDEYGQNNNYLYGSSDLVTNEQLGKGTFVVGNTNLETTKDIFVSVFNNCLDGIIPTTNINAAYIPVYDATSTGLTDLKKDSVLTLLTQRSKATAEPTISFNGVARSDYKVAYFIDTSFSKDTGFQYFVDKYLAPITRTLNDLKLIQDYFWLTNDDISIYDIHKIMTCDNGNYLVLKIYQHIPGLPTKVDLIKLQ